MSHFNKHWWLQRPRPVESQHEVSDFSEKIRRLDRRHQAMNPHQQILLTAALGSLDNSKTFLVQEPAVLDLPLGEIRLCLSMLKVNLNPSRNVDNARE
ncbi:unnamed protein product [Albugo candida]|uniref:Uncharacterized protein n=1 Tax=Albugo candida TaxID=65357 RepID=A0A024FW51_9STRA|nr:unnamed protein product [Albugo candida]|eukprot:CCI10884.1 unnamed protein product [Albugo candida]